MSLIKVRINWEKTTRDSNILCFDFPQEMLCVMLVLLKLVLTVFQYPTAYRELALFSLIYHLLPTLQPAVSSHRVLVSTVARAFRTCSSVTRLLQLLYLLKESPDRGQAAIHSSSLDKKEHKAKYLSPAIRPCFPYPE